MRTKKFNVTFKAFGVSDQDRLAIASEIENKLGYVTLEKNNEGQLVVDEKTQNMLDAATSDVLKARNWDDYSSSGVYAQVEIINVEPELTRSEELEEVYARS